MASGRSTINLLLLASRRTPVSWTSTSTLVANTSSHISLRLAPSRQSYSSLARFPRLGYSPIQTLKATAPPRQGLYSTGKSHRDIQVGSTDAMANCSARTVVVHNKGRARGRRLISFLIISTASFGIGTFLALSYAPPILTPLIMGSMLTDVETLSMYEAPDDFSREVDDYIRESTLAQSLREHPDFTESRPHLKIPAEIRQHNLTAGTLAGPGMIAVPPYYFNERDGKSMVQIFYVGPNCSGHPGIVHGGFLATMLDEGLARCAFPAMPNKVGVTANLQINYLKPTMAGQYLVLRAKTTKVEGRKAWAEGWIESLEVAEGEEPQKLVEATALFVEPRHAKVSRSLLVVTDGNMLMRSLCRCSNPSTRLRHDRKRG